MSDIKKGRTTDDNLVAAVVLAPQGTEAWSALASRFEPRLVRLLNRHHYYLSPLMDTVLPGDGEFGRHCFVDILQETWLAAFTHLHEYDANRAPFYYWLRGLCRNAVKKVRRQYGIPDPAPTNLKLATSNEETATVRRYNLSIQSVFNFDDPELGRVNPNEPKLHPDWMQEYGIDDAPDPGYEHILEELQVALILQCAAATSSPTAVQALEMVSEGASLSEAASSLGLHRKTLARHIRTWAEDDKISPVLVVGN